MCRYEVCALGVRPGTSAAAGQGTKERAAASPCIQHRDRGLREPGGSSGAGFAGTPTEYLGAKPAEVS